jgi:hypothetical protein
MHFLALSPDAAAYYDGLEQRRFNARHHVRNLRVPGDRDHQFQAIVITDSRGA